MAATIIAIAEALAASLEAASFSAPYASVVVARSYSPRYTLEELSELRVTVVPPSATLSLLTRGTAAEGDFVIAVGVQRRTDGTAAAADALALLSEEIARHALALDLGDAHATAVEFAPLYDADLLDEERVFSCVMAVTFKQVIAL